MCLLPAKFCVRNMRWWDWDDCYHAIVSNLLFDDRIVLWAACFARFISKGNRFFTGAGKVFPVFLAHFFYAGTIRIMEFFGVGIQDIGYFRFFDSRRSGVLIFR